MRKTLPIVAVAGLSLAACGGLLAAKAQPQAAYQRVSEAESYKTLLRTYCVACHNAGNASAGIAFDKIDLSSAPADAETWEKVVRKLRGRMMPPPGMPKPQEAQTEAFIGWLEGYLDHAAAKSDDPGQVVLHRLNRREYANAVRDLLAVEIQPAALLPQDGVADGFDTVAEALQVSPSFLDQYIAAARTVAVQAVGEAAPRPSSASYAPAPDEGGKQTGHVAGLPLGTRGGMVVTHVFPADGEYELNIADMIGGIYFLGAEFQHTLVVVLDGQPVYRTTIGGDEDMKAIDQKQAAGVEAINGRLKKIRFKAKAGPRQLGVTFVARTFAESDARLQPLSPGGGIDRLPRVTGFEVRGPFNPTGLSETPSRMAIFVCRPKTKAEQAPCADKILKTVARKAYRRPVTEADMAELRRFYRAGAATGFDEGVRAGLTRILASPDFLYRIEEDPASVAPGAVRRLSDLELASRLSFFLWSSIPDDELLTLAEKGQLHDRKVLEAQVKRMLADPKAEALVGGFAFQWLQLAKLDDIVPDANLFPAVGKHRDVVGFDGDPRAEFKEELRLFIGDVFRRDRSVMDLLTADDTWLNERVALHYGIRDVKGDRFRRVKLQHSVRRGLLGKGAILMANAYPNRTSPVLRGAWILENIVGTPPNPPPPGVEALKDNVEGQKATTVREKMIEHRANPSCNACHGVMDPLGLALEGFDATGAWRERDRFAAIAIDSSGELPTGQKIDGPDDLRAALTAKPDQFVQTFTTKLMTYGLGRKVDWRDMPTVRRIVAGSAADDYRFSSIVMRIVTSDLFQMRRKPAPDASTRVASAKGTTDVH